MTDRFQDRRGARTAQRLVDRAIRLNPEEQTRYLEELQAQRAECGVVLAKIRDALKPDDRPANVVPFGRPCKGKTFALETAQDRPP